MLFKSVGNKFKNILAMTNLKKISDNLLSLSVNDILDLIIFKVFH